MTELMIKKLRRKFIITSTATLVTTMLMIAGFLYAGNGLLNRQIIHNSLDYIIRHNGELVEWNDDMVEESTSTYVRLLDEIFSTNLVARSEEYLYKTRYFAVIFDENQEITDVKTSHIQSVTQTEAKAYGEQALNTHGNFGRIDNYYYKVSYRDDGSSIVVYLDSTDVFLSDSRIFYLALILIGFGMLVSVFLVRIFATRVIRTEVRNAELQKQFMTNASHELKTPIAVIRANTEMQEILQGENEWTQSTLRQVDRMNGLIKNLVMITRADENHLHEDAEEVDITKAVNETVDNFSSLAYQNHLKLERTIAESVHMRAEDAQIRQLCSLLVDNAIKYCDEEGTIFVTLTQKGKNISLVVANSYAEGKNVEYNRFFERFYREDESHNVDKGGYGIGLSIAESLVKQYHGTISAGWKDGVISFSCLLKPARK